MHSSLCVCAHPYDVPLESVRMRIEKGRGTGKAIFPDLFVEEAQEPEDVMFWDSIRRCGAKLLEDGREVLSDSIVAGPDGFLVARFPGGDELTTELTKDLVRTVEQEVVDPKKLRKTKGQARGDEQQAKGAGDERQANKGGLQCFESGSFACRFGCFDRSSRNGKLNTPSRKHQAHKTGCDIGPTSKRQAKETGGDSKRRKGKETGGDWKRLQAKETCGYSKRQRANTGKYVGLERQAKDTGDDSDSKLKSSERKLLYSKVILGVGWGRASICNHCSGLESTDFSEPPVVHISPGLDLSILV